MRVDAKGFERLAEDEKFILGSNILGEGQQIYADLPEYVFTDFESAKRKLEEVLERIEYTLMDGDSVSIYVQNSDTGAYIPWYTIVKHRRKISTYSNY